MLEEGKVGAGYVLYIGCQIIAIMASKLGSKSKSFALLQ
jgi:hypothetical protein